MQKQLEAVVRRAGEIMLSANGSGEVFTKGGTANFATEYDLRIQEYLSGELARILPEAAFVGEEGWNAEKSDSLRWIVDPIDGTTNFMHGLKTKRCFRCALRKELSHRGNDLQPLY